MKDASSRPAPAAPVAPAFEALDRRPEMIEARAAKAGLTMAAICRRADVANSTWTRWKQGKGVSLAVYYRILSAVEKAEAANGASGT